nr:uncharacterized protein I206_01916 [Kwoniella pini CBS 10737]OCF52623.1 hypothetical protein I206_01916 [Kwoniella pini CBS 10737]
MRPPLSQSRPYVSPDPSPLDDGFDQNSKYSQGQLSISPTSPTGLGPTSTPMTIPQPRQSHHQFPVLHSRLPDGRLLRHKYFMNPPQYPSGPAPTHPLSFWQHDQNNDPWLNPMMLPQNNKSRSSKKPKKVEGKQPTFLTRLFGILNQPEYQHIIRWDETGEAIIIENPEELAEKILPVVYRQSRFASFSRQLNIYGFNRKLSLRHVERGICDPDASTWSHPFLNKHSSKAEILAFKRRVPPRPTQAQRRRMILQEGGHSPTSSEQSMDFRSSPDAYQHHLLPDVDEDRPIQFTHPNGSFQPHETHQSSFQAPPPEYYAYRPRSPTAHEFDYSCPVESQAIPSLTHSKPFGSSDRSLYRLDSSSMFDDRGHLMGGPQSAPPITQSFPVPIQVTQQHIRTRSVQGEPPSAMLYSPLSPFNPSSWLNSEVHEPQAKKEDSISPTCLPRRDFDHFGPSQSIFGNEDRSTWQRNRLSTGIPDFKLNNIIDGVHDNSPESLPNDFGSTDSLHLPQIQGQGHTRLKGSLGLDTSSNLDKSQSFPALSPDSPNTISSGIYQGYTFPVRSEFPQALPQARSYDTPPILSKPLTFTPTKLERRLTIPFTPYSPKNKPHVLNGGVLRTISSRRGSPAPIQGLGLKFGEEEHEEVAKGNEALPSASIKFEDPFEDILSGDLVEN